MEDNVIKVLRCRDVGIDCDFVIKGRSVEEILELAKEHAREAHNLVDLDMEFLRSAICYED